MLALHFLGQSVTKDTKISYKTSSIKTAFVFFLLPKHSHFSFPIKSLLKLSETQICSSVKFIACKSSPVVFGAGALLVYTQDRFSILHPVTAKQRAGVWRNVWHCYSESRLGSGMFVHMGGMERQAEKAQ